MADSTPRMKSRDYRRLIASGGPARVLHEIEKSTPPTSKIYPSPTPDQYDLGYLDPNDHRSEEAIQNDIVKTLRTAGAVVQILKGNAKRGGSVYQTPGVQDLLVAYRGKIYLMEVKKHDGKLSDAQKHLHEQMRQQGVIIWIVRGIHGALAVINAAT